MQNNVRNGFLEQGTMLQHGKYRIVRFISAGGFGCTYEAMFEILGARVAIKEFFPRELCNRDATGCMSVGAESQAETVDKLMRKFVAEARTLFKFSGLEGVVKVTDIFEENGTYYYVMDYIDGSSLADILKSRGKLPENEAVRIITEVGHALERVHACNCLHLDIKPGNIMIGTDGRPTLIDFGVSKQYDRGDGRNTSTLMGHTPGYAPLEQLNANVQSFLPATDIYSLGATLYALITGTTPPGAIDLLNDAAALTFPQGVTEQTRNAIKAAMDLRVKDRPQSVSAFLDILNGTDSSIAPNTHTVTNSITTDIDQSTIVNRELPEVPEDEVTIISCQPESAKTCDNRNRNVEVPASSRYRETLMIAAFTRNGEYRNYTLHDWLSFAVEQKNAVIPVGVQLNIDGQQFIIALYDAISNKDVGVPWEYPYNDKYLNCTRITGLETYIFKKFARKDFAGASNTRKILEYGKSHNISFPAAEAAKGYKVNDTKLQWYLPAAGQLYFICKYKSEINNIICIIQGEEIREEWYWSSSTSISFSAWYVEMWCKYMGRIDIKNQYWVRAVADVPSH